MSGAGSLAEQLITLRQRVTEMVASLRAGDPDPDDPFRGLYVTDHHVDRILRSPPTDLAPDPAPDLTRSVHAIDPYEGQSRAQNGGRGDGGPLGALARRVGLSELEVGVLVAALAPDLDPGFEKLYVYLNDDVTRRRASVGVALQLAGAATTGAWARARLHPGAPLVDCHLVTVEDPERPFLTRALWVPDRVCQHLLGDDTLPVELRDLGVPAGPWPDDDVADRLARGIADGRAFVHLHDPGERGGVDLAHAGLRRAGLDAVSIDLGRAPPDGLDPGPISRELTLRGAGLVVANGQRAQPDLLRRLVEDHPVVVVVSRDAWDPALAHRNPVALRVDALGVTARRGIWRDALTPASGNGARPDPPLDPAALDPLRLSPGAIGRSVATARRLAELDRRPLSLDHVRAAARTHASARLERLARRIRPGVTWDDLVVDDATRTDLRLLVTRLRHREQVLDVWGLRRRSGHAEGIAALFAGDSGTGKTLAAEVLAGDLGLDLYVVDLSTVVDKYVGETEKNLERIFTEAEGINGVLFFDEADALFGKRSEVSDARDRYANTEIAYLLQRIERFDGFAVLATNLRANIDDAFLRRLAAVVDFPEPDAELRRRLWALHLATIPDDGGIDLDFLADAFTLSGGNVRNIALTAAYLAADGGRALAMADVVRAVALEYRKLGRLRDESEFGPWLDVLAQDEPTGPVPEEVS